MARRSDSLGFLLAMALVVEGAAVLASVLAAGGGHGSYGVAKAVFPYSMALTGSAGSITAPLCALALVQYPVHALAMGAMRGEAVRRVRWIALAGLHIAAVAWAFAAADSSFTP